jgi:hypothetical protein
MNYTIKETKLDGYSHIVASYETHERDEMWEAWDTWLTIAEGSFSLMELYKGAKKISSYDQRSRA